VLDILLMSLKGKLRHSGLVVVVAVAAVAHCKYSQIIIKDNVNINTIQNSWRKLVYRTSN